MLRIQYHRYGGPDVMKLEDVRIPEPGHGQVLVAEARELGLSEALDYRTFGPAGYPHRFDVVIDAAAALSVTQCDIMLKRGGKAVFVDFPFAKLAAVLTSPRRSLAQGTPSPAHMNGIAGAAGQGKLTAKIARTVSLTEAVAALTDLETMGIPKGKLVITPGT
jgi:NADPH:quinone reductase-like Zn-dependent oxidoreductase